MKKIRMGHRAKFRDRNKCFVHVLFPVCAILLGILTSGILRARFIIETWIHSSLVPRRSPPDHPSRLGTKYRDVTE